MVLEGIYARIEKGVVRNQRAQVAKEPGWM